MLNRIVENSEIAAKNAAFYDHFWDLNSVKFSHFDYIRASFIESTVREFTPAINLEILDLGCGTGWLSSFVNKYGNYVGIDYSPKAIEFAKKQFSNNGRFLLADPKQLKLGLNNDYLFDIVVSSEVIEHVIDKKAFITQLGSFLKTSGLLILTTPNGSVFSDYRKRYEKHFQPVENWLSPSELSELIQENGFSVIRHEGTAYKNVYYGIKSRLVSRRLDSIFKTLGLHSFYKTNLLRISLYQFLVAQKT